MTKFGVFIVFIGWVTSMEGYTFGHVLTILLGLSLIIGGLYLANR